MGLGEGDFVIVEPALIPIDRIAAEQPYYQSSHVRTAPRCGSHARHRAAPTIRPRPAPTTSWEVVDGGARLRDLEQVRAFRVRCGLRRLRRPQGPRAPP